MLQEIHYSNIPMHYAEAFKGCKKDIFLTKIFDIFLMFAQNTYFGYMFEYPQSMF